MELKGIDAKLFTLEKSQSVRVDYLIKDGKKHIRKYPGDFASGIVAVYDERNYRELQVQTGKISVASFPGATYGTFEEYTVCNSFLQLHTCYQKEK